MSRDGDAARRRGRRHVCEDRTVVDEHLVRRAGLVRVVLAMGRREGNVSLMRRRTSPQVRRS